MTIKTWLLYLVGQRQAILTTANCRGGLWLGLLFVLSAGFAREYDGEDLLHEPWHLLIPFAASLGSSLALYLLIYLVSLVRGPRTWPSLSAYRAILQLFWLTAPLAWLYAIPFERFLSPADATRANLYLLAFVALWRVLLMSRAVSVLYQVRYIAALGVVMLFADAVLLEALALTTLPDSIILGMSGIRVPESDRLLAEVSLILRVLGFLSIPVWFLGAVVSSFAQRWEIAPSRPDERVFVRLDSWLLAGIALATWCFVLPYTQPEQQNRWRVETALRSNRVAEAVALMSGRDRRDFPPHWDPPPRLALFERRPSLMALRLAVEVDGVAPWVREIFVDKLQIALAGHFWNGVDPLEFEQMEDTEFSKTLDALRRIPEGPRIAAKHKGWAKRELKDGGAYLSYGRREQLEQFLLLADEFKGNEVEWD